MAGVNKAIVLGNIGSIDIRQSRNGGQIVNLSVATTSKRKVGNDWEESTVWHKIVLFGKTADYCVQYAQKGSKIYAEGMMMLNKWQDKSGNERESTQIMADVFQILNSSSQGDEYESRGGSQGRSSNNGYNNQRGRGGRPYQGNNNQNNNNHGGNNNYNNNRQNNNNNRGQQQFNDNGFDDDIDF